MIWAGFQFALGAIIAIGLTVAVICWAYRERSEPRVVTKWGTREWIFLSLIVMAVLGFIARLYSP